MILFSTRALVSERVGTEDFFDALFLLAFYKRKRASDVDPLLFLARAIKGASSCSPCVLPSPPPPPLRQQQLIQRPCSLGVSESGTRCLISSMPPPMPSFDFSIDILQLASTASRPLVRWPAVFCGRANIPAGRGGIL